MTSATALGIPSRPATRGVVIVAIVAAMGGLAFLSVYLAGALFLGIHKANPLAAHAFSLVHYWQRYGGDPIERKRLVGATAVSTTLCLVVLPLAALATTRRRRELHGSARFANVREIGEAGLFAKQGLIVGKLGRRFLLLPGELFVLLAAPTRSGKDVGIVIPNLLHYPGSVVVNDIKGELFDKTAGFRAQNGQRVFKFAPFDEACQTHRYNPLGYVRNQPRFRVADLLSIGQVLYPNDGQSLSSEGFFNDQARNLFLGLSLYLLDSPEQPRSIGQLLRAASSVGKPLKEHLQAVMAEREKSPRPLGDDTLEALARFVSNPDNTLGSIQSTFNAPLTIFADPIVDVATSANDFSLSALRRTRMSVYLHVPPNRLKDSRLLLNLFFTQVIYLNTRELPERDPELKVECLLVMNEFTSLGRVNILADAVGYIAGYGLRLLTVVQSMAQLGALYGDKVARNFATNHALRILYAPQEQDDAKEYSEVLGIYTERADSHSRNRSHSARGDGSSRGTSTSSQRRALMLPQELRELGADRQVVVYEKCKPILAQKIRYFDDEAFDGRVLPPPLVPVQDWQRERARATGRTRFVTASEAADIDLSDLAHAMDNLPVLHDHSTDVQIRAFVDAFFERLDVQPSSEHPNPTASLDAPQSVAHVNVIEQG